jgi:O-antigen ligase
MHVYGTLGNPNFVAALAAITIPLAGGLVADPSASHKRRLVMALALVVLAAALVVSGSRAGALGLGCGVVAFAAFLHHRRSRWIMACAVCAAIVAVVASGARGPVETVRGRLYIWQIAWAHAWEQPFAGVGPGAFELYYAAWDEGARASRNTNTRTARFAGPQQFAHNDYLQALVERGVAGLASTSLVLATPLLLWRRSRRGGAETRARLAGAAGAVAACAAVACVDFPLERPAEAAALWMAIAMAWPVTTAGGSIMAGPSPESSQPDGVCGTVSASSTT